MLARMRERAIHGGLALCLLGCGPTVAVGDSADGGNTATGVNPSTGGPATSPNSTTTGTTRSSTTALSSTGPGALDDTGVASAGMTWPPDWGHGHNDCRIGGDECPKAEKCMPWASDGGDAWNAKRCTPLAADPASVGSPCVVEGGPASGVDSCEANAMCWSVDPETNTGTCAPLCEYAPGDDICADPDKICTLDSGPLEVCLDGCDPLVNDCPAGESCYLLNPFLLADRVAVCLRPGTPIFVNVDVFPAFCEPGWTAISPLLDPTCAHNELCCAPWCDTSEPECPDGRSCIPWTPPGRPKDDDVGFCVSD
ncbi:MAG: hypothetical protein JKY37_15820, partial [Nannocystaceae bacterium]|nr:hypothetical protein [Nannocystaceae bacterium]